MSIRPSVRILILNYNGKALLEKYLPSFQRAVRKSAFSCALGVVDNQSRDGSVEWLEKNYPGVSVYRAKENLVLCSYNDAAREFQEDILIFMNNDIDVEEDFIDPLIEPFLTDEKVFMVTPRCLSQKDGAYEGNKTHAAVRHGIFWSSSRFEGYEKTMGLPGLTAQGGFGAFHRQKFLEIGGYDTLYLPGRLEDADVCFHAYKRGWKCLYEPESVVYHEGGTSFHQKFGIRGTLVINWKNTFLFMWKNFSDRINFLETPLWLPVWFLRSLLRGEPEFIVGWWQALAKFGQARRSRRALGRDCFAKGPSEREIFRRVSAGPEAS